MIRLIDLILEQESGGQLYHFTTLVDGLQIVNPSSSLIWSQAVRKGDGSVPFFSLTSKRSFDSGYPLIQKHKAENLEDLRLVRISFDKERLEHYVMNPYHYDASNAQGDLKAALEKIEDPNDRDEAEIRITRQNRRETLQDLRDSISSVDILVDDWIYTEFTKTLQTKNKFEGLVRSYFDSSQNAFRDKTHIVSSSKGVEKSTDYWKDKKLGQTTGHPLTYGLQFPELRPKYDYNDSVIKQIGHLVAYCSKLLPAGALKYFDGLSTDEISAIGDAAKHSPGNSEAAENAFRTLNIQNKLKGPQKAVLNCILNMVDDFEDYLKEEGVLDPNKQYRFDEIVDTLRKEDWINENKEMGNFDYKQYLVEGWLHQEVKREPKQATTADLKGFATKTATLDREKRAQKGNWKGSVGKFVDEHGPELSAAYANRQLRPFIEKTMKPALGEEAAEYLDNLLASCRNDTRLLMALYNVSMKGSGLGLHESADNEYPKAKAWLQQHPDVEVFGNAADAIGDYDSDEEAVTTATEAGYMFISELEALLNSQDEYDDDYILACCDAGVIDDPALNPKDFNY